MELTQQQARKSLNEHDTFTAWLAQVSPRWPWHYTHLEYIRAHLQRVTGGECKRLMIFLPPRHYKSEMVTVRYSAWRLECDPSMRVIVGAYNQLLADKFSRKARRIVETRIPLAKDRQAVQDWETQEGGGLRAVGVGSGITGQGGELVIIDDPVKSREEAQSEVYREKVWDWYTDDIYTRLEADSAVILIMCMTGDTAVTMADGSRKALRDIRKGDLVATYDNGVVRSSVVQNWTNQGPDDILEIRMKSGTSVKANERHPFLVDRGGRLEWIRVRNLRLGDKIVTAQNGASIGASPVRILNATNLRSAKATVTHTTTKPFGPVGTDHPRSTHNRAALPGCVTDTASMLLSTMRLSLSRVASALSAVGLPGRTSEPIGVGSCASTTTMPRGKSEDCSVMTATSWSDTVRQAKCCYSPLNTFAIGSDSIEQIVAAGREDVFDIQVAETENFIANGLVSHNTRWHEDDLAGRILASEQAADWTVCSLPAEAEEGDPLGREIGEALCPEKFDLAALADRRAVLGNSYYALYQQRPQPKEGEMFKEHWFKIVRAVPSGTTWVRYWDNAGTAGGGDYSAGVLMGRTPEGRYIVADVARGQWSPHERESMKQLTAAQDAETYGRVVIWNEQEPGSAGKESAATTIRNLAGYAVYAETATGDKVTRAEPFAAQCEAGNVDLLSGPWNGKYLGELTAFPNGKRKDQVDGSSGAFNKLAQVSAGVFF